MEDLYYNKYVKYKTKYEVLYDEMYGGFYDTECKHKNINKYILEYITFLTHLNSIITIINDKIEQIFDVEENDYKIKNNSKLYKEIEKFIKDEIKENIVNSNDIELSICDKKVNIKVNIKIKDPIFDKINLKINEIIKTTIESIFELKEFQINFKLNDKNHKKKMNRLNNDFKKILLVIKNCNTSYTSIIRGEDTINNKNSRKQDILQFLSDKINILADKIKTYNEKIIKLYSFINYIINNKFSILLSNDVCKINEIQFGTETSKNYFYQKYYNEETSNETDSILRKYEEYITQLTSGINNIITILEWNNKPLPQP